MIRSYLWSEAYATAVLEMDPAKVVDRICEAERAIRRRSQDAGLDYHELKAMGDAAVALRNLFESRADLPGEDSTLPPRHRVSVEL
jgi:hypothetical protein